MRFGFTRQPKPKRKDDANQTRRSERPAESGLRLAESGLRLAARGCDSRSAESGLRLAVSGLLALLLLLTAHLFLKLLHDLRW